MHIKLRESVRRGNMSMRKHTHTHKEWGESAENNTYGIVPSTATVFAIHRTAPSASAVQLTPTLFVAAALPPAPAPITSVASGPIVDSSAKVAPQVAVATVYGVRSSLLSL